MQLREQAASGADRPLVEKCLTSEVLSCGILLLCSVQVDSSSSSSSSCCILSVLRACTVHVRQAMRLPSQQAQGPIHKVWVYATADLFGRPFQEHITAVCCCFYHDTTSASLKIALISLSNSVYLTSAGLQSGTLSLFLQVDNITSNM